MFCDRLSDVHRYQKNGTFWPWMEVTGRTLTFSGRSQNGFICLITFNHVFFYRNYVMLWYIKWIFECFVCVLMHMICTLESFPQFSWTCDALVVLHLQHLKCPAHIDEIVVNRALQLMDSLFPREAFRGMSLMTSCRILRSVVGASCVASPCAAAKTFRIKLSPCSPNIATTSNRSLKL